MSDIRFNDRVAIVTGAGAGLGKSYALELAARGARVVVNDLGGERDGSGSGATTPADQVVEEIKKAGGEAVANYDSVATIEGGKNIAKTAVDNYGKVDILINNAGILRDKSLLKMPEEDWDIVNDVHLKGAFCTIQPVFAVMKANGYGRIVNTTSHSGLYGNFGQANYCAAKTGLIGLMNNVCIEGAKYNIKCNTVAPMAASRLTEDITPPDLFEKIKPEFVTPLVVFLCSEENTDTKMIFNCGLGWFSRSELVCAPGATIGDGKRPIAAEEVRDEWSKITSLDDAKPFPTSNDIFVHIMPLLS